MSAQRLSRLRHQMLVALGLPACWTGPATPGPTIAQVESKAPVKIDFDSRTCAVDEIVETACGSLDEAYRTCGTKGDRLGQRDQLNLFVSDEDAVRNFSFDKSATSNYRTEIDDDSATSCCYSQCSKLAVATSTPVTPIPPGYHQTRTCLPIPPGGTSAPAADEPRCPANVLLNKRTVPYVTGDDASCCYLTPIQDRIYSPPIRGRAARVDGTPAFAPTTTSAQWTDVSDVAVEHLDGDTRARLAAAWIEAARMEHASIASFANLSLRLLALGAPPELVAGAHAAALDEIRHAQAAFAIASAYAGETIGPAPFTDAMRMSASGSLADLAIETMVDGCIGETVAALEAERAADCASDPAIAVALRAIAADEAQHAELAWAIVGWCTRREPSIVSALRSSTSTSTTTSTTSARDGLVAHGVLDGAALAAVHADAMRAIIAPCLAAL